MSFFVLSISIAMPDTSPMMFASTYSPLPIFTLDDILRWLYILYSVLVILPEVPESAILTSLGISVHKRLISLPLETSVISATSLSVFVSEVTFAFSVLFFYFSQTFLWYQQSVCL